MTSHGDATGIGGIVARAGAPNAGRRGAPLALALLVAFSLAPAPARAQAAPGAVEASASEAPDAASAESPAAAREVEFDDEYNRGTPRSAVRSYLEAARASDWKRAAEYLELPPALEREGATLARQLKVVLDQTLWVDLDALSASREGKQDDGLPANRDKLGEIPTSRGPAPILLERVPRADGPPVWEFAGATVARVPALYEEHGYGPLGEYLPHFFFEIRFLELQLWQWIGLITVVFLAAVLAWIATSVLLSAGGRILRRTRTTLDDRALDLVAGPLRLVLAVYLFSAGKLLLNLAVPVRQVISEVESAFVIFAVAWVFLRIVDLLAELARSLLVQRQQTTAIPLLSPGTKTLKVLILGVAFVAMMDSFGYNVTALVAGLGVGGIAVALAAQKSLESIFGGVTIYAARPVRVGDFCRFGDKIGTVEEIGLRYTRVRTLDRTVVHVPNAEFASIQLENFASRDRIWYHPRIGLRYETTPDQLRYVLVEIRKMLYAHPKVHPDPARIRFVGFGAYSLDLDVFAYVKVTDYGEYLEVAEDLNLRIMDIVGEAGSSFAFPSQTTYLEQGEGLDAERAKAAAENVRRWREEKSLYLPRFPQEKIQELGSTLPYPPPGSPPWNGG